MKRVLYIGGSPCSGKSTVAELLSKKYDLHYFKVDDCLEKYTNRGTEERLPVCMKLSNMTAEETWMRDPVCQCKEEIQFYREIFPFVLQDLEELVTDKIILAEGAAFLPELVKRHGVVRNDYLAITPSKEFQINHYRQREWIHYVLRECSNFEKAFENWMDRDCYFANEVNKSCIENGYFSVLNDGSFELKDLMKTVSKHFGFQK